MSSDASSVAEPPAVDAPRATRVRHFVLAALAGMTVGAYLTRVCLAAAASTIQAELDLGDVAMGYVLGAFAIGYTWLQIPGGWVGNRMGARASLTVFCLIWSVSTIGTALAGSDGVMWWTRLVCGLAQAGLFPMAIAAVAVWYPASRRGSASAVITAFMSVGAVLASGLTALLLGPLGWRSAFQAYGWAGVVFALGFYAWYRNTPEEHPATNEAERDLIRSGRPEAGSKADDGDGLSDVAAFGRMLTSPSMGALCVQAFFRAFGYYFFVTWFPTYLERGFGVDRETAGASNMLPLAGVVAGSFVGGALVDRILRGTGSRYRSRTGVAVASLLLCALATLSGVLAETPTQAVALITLGTFFSGFAGPATWAATMDLSGRHTAIGFSLMNMSGNLGAIACPIVVGYQIDAIRRTGGSWDPVLYLFAGIYAAGAVAWAFLDPNRSAVAPRPTPPPPDDPRPEV